MRALLRTADGAYKFKEIQRVEHFIYTHVMKSLLIDEYADPTRVQLAQRKYGVYRQIHKDVWEYREIVT